MYYSVQAHVVLITMSCNSKRSIVFNIGSQNNQNEVLKKFCYTESPVVHSILWEKKYEDSFSFIRIIIKPEQQMKSNT